jgi:hypothetical protein
MDQQNEEERRDHPHHRSFWFGHGDVNHVDFWTESRGAGTIRHEAFVRVERQPVPVIETRNGWLTEAGEKLCSDYRTISFGADAERRWIDFDIVLVNDSELPVVFGDTKEGSFGVRVAESLKVDAGRGGMIVNSLGARNRDAWGRQASWVDYHGLVDNEFLGIAVLNHPNSFRFPTYWHVRTYGLLAANVFGVHNFKNTHEESGAHTLESGQSIAFYFRVILHRGNEQQGRIPEAFAEYVKVDKPFSGVLPPAAQGQVPLVPAEAPAEDR